MNPSHLQPDPREELRQWRSMPAIGSNEVAEIALALGVWLGVHMRDYSRFDTREAVRVLQRHRAIVTKLRTIATIQTQFSTPITPPPTRAPAPSCCRCDSSGMVCATCGESSRACRCKDDEQDIIQCPDCQPNKPKKKK